MLQRLVFLFLTTSFLLIAGCEMDNSQELLNVSYGADEEQIFDLYLPNNRNQESTNVIVLVHGGGWVEGDKSEIEGFYDYMVNFSDNYAVVNLNYRLGDLIENPIPNQMEDIATFIEFFKEEAENYIVNPTFSFFGISAGAHLSMLYSYQFDVNQDIKVVCNMIGPTDFLHASYVNATDSVTTEFVSNVEEIIGLPIQGNELFYESISPRYFVNDSTVPTISFYGGEDLFTPEEQGQVLRDELNNFNRINEYIIYPDGGHGWGESDTFDTLDRVIEFIDEHIL